MKPIPFVDLTAHHKPFRTKFLRSMDRQIRNSSFILGRDVEQFEQAFAKYTGTKHAVGVSSGLDALRLALTAAGIGPGHEVVLPVNTFAATALAVVHAGARPRFVDMDRASYNLDPALLKKAVTRKTKAVIPVHLYGQPADMAPILSLARRRGLVVIEDAAQAHGAKYRKKRVGCLGHLGCFSFYPGKNLGALGDGGAVTTNNPAFAKKLAMLRHYGQEKKYEHAVAGYNNRLDSVQAAFLTEKLKELDRNNRRRQQIAKTYNQAFSKMGIVTPVVGRDRTHVYHLYVVRHKRRDRIRKELSKNGIANGIYYPTPLHRQKCFRSLGYRKGDFPVIEEVVKEQLALPIYPELPMKDVRRIIDVVGRAI